MIQRIRRVLGNPVTRNAFFLLLLTMSNYLVYFLTVPYQARVLGAELFGKVAFATAIAAYFQLFFDFGFMLSGTAQIASADGDVRAMSRINSTIILAKLPLLGVALVALTVMCFSVPAIAEDPALYVLAILSVAPASLLPDYVYRGIQRMRPMSVRVIGFRLLSALLLFAVVRSPADYLLVPVTILVGNAASLVWTLADIRRRGIRWVSVPAITAWRALRESSSFFASRAATASYTALNVVAVGAHYGSASLALAHYSAADRLIVAVKTAATPVVDSIYPYMVRSRNHRALWRVFWLLVPAWWLGCLALAVWSEPIVETIFGPSFAPAAIPLTLLAPVAMISLPSMLLGFPALTPLGRSREVNVSNIAGALLHLAQVGWLLLAGSFSVVNVCVASIVTEVFILAFRIVSVRRAMVHTRA